MPTLVVEKGHDKGKSIPVPASGTVLVGRDNSTALPLRDTMTSRMHFKIEARDGEWWIDDLGSMNGTYLNGAKLKLPVKLELGDLIKAGETLFTFQTDANSATTLSGTRIGGYRIIERVGRGGMGTVYKAEQIDLQRLVALKVMSEEHTKQKDFVELFIHEARAAAKLNHPNVVQVYDVKKHNESYFISMEFVSGGSVQELLNKHRKLPVEDCVRMIADAARGLEYAHKKGIVHRDVKPDNLMIAESGSVKIGDMGLARGLDEKVGPEEETSVIGTPHYIAPEQVLGKPADFRSDVYSLGATMYRMLTGVTPFTAPSVRELVNRKVRDEAPLANEHAPEVPRELSVIVSRMMARDPEKRCQTMGEVVAALEKFQRGQLDTRDLKQATRSIGLLLRGRAGLAAASVLAVVLGGLLWFVLGAAPPPPPDPSTRGPDPALLQQMFENAKLYERRQMDKADPRSIEKCIEEYQAVIDKAPGTALARSAAELRDALRKMHREVSADRQAQMIEAREIAAHRKAVEDFRRTGRLDLSGLDESLSAVAAFAQSEAAKGTPAAKRAEKSADALRRWRSLVGQLSERYERTVGEASALRDLEKFREARELLAGLRDDVRRFETDPQLAKDRYRELLFDEPASREIEKVVSDARGAWIRAEGEARAMARDRHYDAAFRMIDAVLADSVEDVAQAARAVRETLEQERAMLDRIDMEAKAVAEAAARQRALEAFAAESRGVRDLVLRFEFKEALRRMKVLRDGNTVDELRARLDRRVAELERIVHLKDTLINVFQAPNNPYKVKKDYSPGGIEGWIEALDDRGLQIALGPGGTTSRLWSEFTPAGFLDFIRRQWKYSTTQRRDANDQVNLAAWCLEAGLYREAEIEIEQVLNAMKDPLYVAPEAVRTFCVDYKTRIERGDSAEHEEIEAEKRIAHLDLTLRRNDLAAARAEIDVLRSRFGKTKAYLKAQPDIDAHLQRIEKEGGDALQRSRKDERHRALLARVAEEQSAVRRAQSDIVLRLGRIEDLFQRNLHLGAVHAFAGDWRTSTEKYGEARRLGEAMLDRREAGPEFLEILGKQVYAELLRNAVLLKDRKGAELLRNQGARRFVNPETRNEESWWTSIVDWTSTWSDVVYPQEERKVARLRDEVKANPDDAQKIWALAQSLSEGVAQTAEARGYYAWLLENHPDFPQVANGNCLHRYAELLYAARDIGTALRRYNELLTQVKDHPKVLDGGPSGVKRRVEDCLRLQNRMGGSSTKAK